MRSPDRRTLAALALALAACQGASTAPSAPGLSSGASVVAAVNATATNAIPGPPPELELKGLAAFASAGPAAVPLTAGTETTIEPKATFRVELPISLGDARLSLLDGGDAMVPSSGAREVGQATVLTLTPSVALAAGARFRLRVDGVATRELHAADGRRFAPVEWLVVVAGESEPRTSAGRKGKRR